MQLRTNRCPYCFAEFRHSEFSSDVEMAPNCGHIFTLGEAWRGRPDPIPDPAVAALTERVRQLEERLGHVEAAIRWA